LRKDRVSLLNNISNAHSDIDNIDDQVVNQHTMM
jgi:hypothetical protein